MNEGSHEGGDLVDVFQSLSAKLGEIHVELRGERAEYRRGGNLFATAEGNHVELRLQPEIADAARHTPSTAACARGEEWVTFAPPELDRHAVDRAEAWFLSAWRGAVRPRQ